MASKKNSGADILEIQVHATQADINKCVAKHIQHLERIIRGDGAPLDGSIETLITAIHLLRTVVIAVDDPAGRGIGAADELMAGAPE